ncbi:MAG TPA: glutamate 5-kinase [Myxococcaceae bacterium]|nr:glutamate 5-kinase [Myxococcaceae bacterium]
MPSDLAQPGTRPPLGGAQRIVVKLGTQVVTHDGRSLALGRLMSLVEEMALLRQEGRQILLVSSGAVALGMKQLGLTERPRSLGLRQACAAVGQGHLVGLYTQAFAQFGVTAAQVLLTESDLGDRDRALCVRTTLMRLLELRAVPVLNENDSVSIRELVEHRRAQGAETGAAAFGDNDGLSARVAVGVDADLLVLLTDVDGLYTADPRTDPDARRIEVLDAETPRLGAVSAGGTGGMSTKLEAARLASRSGVTVVIASGAEPNVLRRLLSGEAVGTCVPPAERRAVRRQRIALAPHAGALVANDGALSALEGGRASLLPIGVVAVEGDFREGEVVEIRDASGRVRGRGLANYDARACRALLGRHSEEIEDVLGWRGYDALVTRDNLVLGS